jgi:hypothetical protein
VRLNFEAGGARLQGDDGMTDVSDGGVYPRRLAARLEGAESFREGTRVLPFNVKDFWQWSVSDLLSNTTRGRLAEYLVARALGLDVDTTVRDEWDACDLWTPEGVRIEVKSSAYLQSWFQHDVSPIRFGIAPARAWDPEQNTLAEAPCRTADLYVFALLRHRDKATVDPLDVSQWRFYVLPTDVLNRQPLNPRSLTLRALERLTSALPFDELSGAVEAVANGLARRGGSA